MAKQKKSQKEILTACARHAQLLLVLMIIWDIGCILAGTALDKSDAYFRAHGARILTLMLVRWAFGAAESITELLCDIAEQRAMPGRMPESAFPAPSSPAQTAPAAQAAPQSAPGTYSAQAEADIYRMSQRRSSTGAEAVQGFIDGKEV